MRVLVLADRLSERGGADAHLLHVITELGLEGVEVELGVGRVDEGTHPPCRVHLVPGLAARGAQALPLEALVREVRPDLLHLQNVMNPAALAWAASGRLPALCTVQDHRGFCPGRGKWRADGAVCRQPMRRARCAACFDDAGEYFASIFALTEERLASLRRLPCVVLSRYMAGELEGVGVPAAQVRCIPPFVSGLGEPAVPQGPPCVLFAGRLVPAKGVVEAASIWQRAQVPLPLVLAGAGPERGRLPRLEGLELAGWLSRPDLGQLFARAEALLLPSRWQEPFGIVGVEALAFGVPVVAWRSGGVEEWHPGPLCEWGDLDGMAAALRQAIGRRGAEAAARVEKERVMGMLVGTYGEISGRRV